MDAGGSVQIGGFEERVIATVDGLALYARDYPALAPVTGVPVICLHGLTRNSRDFDVIAPRIAALGRRVIAADMRGRGKSANDPDPAHYVPAVYAQDVLKLMDMLTIPQAVFVGTSMGGIITMLLAATAPDRIAASVLNDVGPKLSVEGLGRIASYVGHVVPMANWQAAADAARETQRDVFPDRRDEVDFWMAHARRTCRELEDGRVELDYDPHIALAFADFDPEAPPPDMTPIFQALATKPILVVRGALSDVLPPATVALMRSMKADLDVAEIEHVGHAPTLDEAAAWDAILDFLAKVP